MAPQKLTNTQTDYFESADEDAINADFPSVVIKRDVTRMSGKTFPKTAFHFFKPVPKLNYYYFWNFYFFFA